MSKPIKILHGPKNIASVPYNLAAGERALGYDSISATEWDQRYTFKSDILFDVLRRPLNSMTRQEFYRKKLLGFDVYHLHYGESMTGPKLQDVPLLKMLGKSVFMHF